MAIRTINGPGENPTQEYVSAKEAGDYMGVSGPTFERAASQQPWIRLKHIGDKPLYHWLDVIALARILDCTDAIGTKNSDGPQRPPAAPKGPQKAKAEDDAK